MRWRGGRKVGTDPMAFLFISVVKYICPLIPKHLEGLLFQAGRANQSKSFTLIVLYDPERGLQL